MLPSKKYVTEKITCKQRVNLLNPYLLTILFSIPFLNELPCFQPSNNCQHQPNLGDIFEPLLAIWTEELADKASTEMKNLFDIQKEEKEENDLKDTKAENWKAFDQTYYIKGIFFRSHTQWHAKCKDFGLSAKTTDLYSKYHCNDLERQCLKNLYLRLVDVLYEYRGNLENLILQDKDFDKSEFIMVINCMHASVDYLNDIFNIEDGIFFRLPKKEGEFFYY